MSISVTITLTAAGAGTGPFNLFSDTDSFVNPFEGNIGLSQLLSGYVSTLVPTGTTVIRVKSAGLCTNYVDLTISIPSPTPTPTISNTPSATPTVTPTISLTPSVTPTVTPSISLTPTVTPTITPSISKTPSVSLTPSISLTPTVSPSVSGIPTGCYIYVNYTGGDVTVTYIDCSDITYNNYTVNSLGTICVKSFIGGNGGLSNTSTFCT
jgi:hypothetical protein